MRCTVEILNRFAAARPAAALLYAPLETDLTVRESRVYVIDVAGRMDALKGFAERVLADPVTDEIGWDDEPLVAGYQFRVDIALKPGLLDLEGSYLLDYHRKEGNGDLRIEALATRRRLYFFGAAEAERAVIRDLVNPVIHQWEVRHATGNA